MATLTLNTRKDFGATTVAGPDATHWGIYETENGADFLQGGENDVDTPALAIGDNFYMAANSIVITLAANIAERLSEAGARKYLRGLVENGVWLLPHSGDPGNTGVNKISGNGISRVEAPLSNWTVA